LNARVVAVLSVVVIVLLAGGFLVATQMGATTSTSGSSATSSTESQSATSTTTGASTVSTPQGLQLRLSVGASYSGGASGNTTIQIGVDEYNTLASANNVSVARQFGMNGLSLGSCGMEAYPFGVALYRGAYTTGNVSAATPIQIYPITACPMLLRLVTAYLFQPTSDMAVILPSGPNAAATPMSANITATTEYGSGMSLSYTPLGPGTYSVAAGDEWGSVVVIRFTVGAGAGTSSTVTGTGQLGTLGASFSIGPTAPVCMANATIGPAPQPYASLVAVVTSSSGQISTFPISWVSNGCEAMGVAQASLAPGSYSLNLSSCTFMGCTSALPKSFTIAAGQSTSVDVSVDTGIR
jgi:hypothetical protein